MISDDAQSQNRRGRPATGTNPSVGVRLPPDILKLVDRFRAAEADLPSRPEAIRRLIERGLQRDGLAAQAYQVIGALAGEAGVFEHPEAVRALDYFHRGEFDEGFLPFKLGKRKKGF